MPSNRPPKIAWQKLGLGSPTRSPKRTISSTTTRLAATCPPRRDPSSGAAGLQPQKENPSDELQRYRHGEISEAEYLAACVERATVHLRGRVSSRKLSRIREVVHELCATDPVLAAMKERVLRPRK